MRIMHNRSGFADKQIIRLQEAPEHIPEGETPHTQSMCTWDLLVDVAKPGDRVEVTGIFRATSVRTNPRHRTLRAIYKTYVDIVHVRKIDKGKRLQQEAPPAAATSTPPLGAIARNRGSSRQAEPTVATAAGEARAGEAREEYHEGNELDAVSDARVAELKAGRDVDH